MRLSRALLLALAAVSVAGCGSSAATHGRSQPPQVQTFSDSTPYPHAAPAQKPAPRAPAGPGRPAPRRVTAGGAVPAPAIVQRPIPFPAARRQEMARYAQRHYGFSSYRLRNPQVIVEHYTETPTFAAAYNTFAPDVPDSELHELPNTCAHFIVDRDGTIYQLVPISIMCRHTVGLNWTAIGIEHVGMSDAAVMGDAAELRSSLRLTRWLRCRLGISVSDVIGHNESLSSPYHREQVASLRSQTHSDMQRATMDRYRQKLARLGC